MGIFSINWRGIRDLTVACFIGSKDGTGTHRMTAAEARTLLNVADGATANSSDAALLARANHTGTQAQSTVTNLVTDLAAKADLVGGVVPTSQIPSIAITEYLGTAANQAAMLALSGEKGDWCDRTDTGSVWVITGTDPAVLGDWTELSYPGAPVTSVNGQTGIVVLGNTDVGAASAAQGTTADSAVQPGDNVSDLTNDAGYTTVAAVAAGYQPLDSDLTAIAALTTAAYGRAFLSLADAAASRTYIAAAAAVHSHAISDVTNLTTSLAAKADLVGGVVPTSQIPAVAITEYLGTVASQAAMLLLDGDRGDWCLRSDTGSTWILAADDSSLLASWVEINYPTAPVTSVNSQTGAVSLGYGDVGAAAASHSHTLLSITDAGTAAAADTVDFATAAQGSTADSALQPSDIASGTITARTGDIDLSGGSDGHVLTVQADGSLALEAAAGGGGSPGGSSGQLQYNNAGAFGGTTAIVYAGSGTHLTVTAQAVTDVPVAFKLAASQTANAFEINSSSGSGGDVLLVGPTADVDLVQKLQVSSGNIVAGGGVTSTGSQGCICIGDTCSIGNFSKWTVVLGRSINVGTFATASFFAGYMHTINARSVVFCVGYLNRIDADGSVATGSQSFARFYGQRVHSIGQFAAVGDNQSSQVIMRVKTTDATPTEMFVNGSSARLTIASGIVATYKMEITGIKSDGSAVAVYHRLVTIKNVGGTTSLVGSVQTVGTDHEDNASTDVSITADDTNDSLKVEVTGIASETWRWFATLSGHELGYGT